MPQDDVDVWIAGASAQVNHDFGTGIEMRGGCSRLSMLGHQCVNSDYVLSALGLIAYTSVPLWHKSPRLLKHECATGEAPYCEAKNDERKWCQKEDRSHRLVSTANTAHQGRRKKNNAAKLSRLF